MRESEKLVYLVQALQELLFVFQDRPDIKTHDGVTIHAFIKGRLAAIEEKNSRERCMLEQWFRSDIAGVHH